MMRDGGPIDQASEQPAPRSPLGQVLPPRTWRIYVQGHLDAAGNPQVDALGLEGQPPAGDHGVVLMHLLSQALAGFTRSILLSGRQPPKGGALHAPRRPGA